MLSEDLFRSRLEATVASLSYWAPTIKNAARVETRDDAGAWRITVTPHLRTACALDLTIRASQRYDIGIGGERIEDIPVESFDVFVPLAEAVAEGDVVRRRWVTPATGAEHSVETIVLLPGGAIWRAERANDTIARLVPRDDCICREHRFPPYHRI